MTKYIFDNENIFDRSREHNINEKNTDSSIMKQILLSNSELVKKFHRGITVFELFKYLFIMTLC